MSFSSDEARADSPLASTQGLARSDELNHGPPPATAWRAPSHVSRVGPWPKLRQTIALVVVLSLALSLVAFAIALPETTRADSGCCAPGSSALAKDFSAYYVAAWRLFHDPANIYTKGSVPDGGPQVLPQPQGYKYLPSFLVLAAPLLLLPYQTALLAFDFFQLLLLPLVALLLYRIM